MAVLAPLLKPQQRSSQKGFLQPTDPQNQLMTSRYLQSLPLVILGLLSSSPADIYTSKTTEPEAPDAAPSKGTVVSQSEGQRARKDIILRPQKNVWNLGKLTKLTHSNKKRRQKGCKDRTEKNPHPCGMKRWCDHSSYLAGTLSLSLFVL